MSLGVPPRKKPRLASDGGASADLEGAGGLYDFLPPPDPSKDAARKAEAAILRPTRPKLPPEDRSRVIFLDVDGVLLPTNTLQTIVIDGVKLPAQATVKETDFSIAALGSLRDIVRRTGAIIVLSSEWRRGEELRSSIAAVMKSFGVPPFRETTPLLEPRGELQRASPLLAWCERRSREIGKWLKEHPEVTAWVALDDLDFTMADSVKLPNTPWIKARSVLTHDRLCLTEQDAEAAVQILLNPPPEPKAKRRSVQVDLEAPSDAVLCGSAEDTERIQLGF